MRGAHGERWGKTSAAATTTHTGERPHGVDVSSASPSRHRLPQLTQTWLGFTSRIN